jgi:DNA-binding CsgD family transcriptional regulator
LALGDVARELENPADVRLRCEESLAIFRELGESLGEGFSLHNLAVAAYQEGHLDLARTLAEESLAIFRRLEVGRAIVEALASLGPILDAIGDHALALAALMEALPLAFRVGPRWVVAAVLEGLANLAAGQRQDRVAVELASSAAALRMEIGVPVRPNCRAALEHTLAMTRARLGEETFAVGWTRGHQQPLPDVIAAAAEVRITSPGRASRSKGAQETDRPFGLSPRELDVLRHLVAGKTDREIAGALFIGTRTVETHVSHLFTKLGVTARAEAAAVAVRSGLA